MLFLQGKETGRRQDWGINPVGGQIIIEQGERQKEASLGTAGEIQ